MNTTVAFIAAASLAVYILALYVMYAVDDYYDLGMSESKKWWVSGPVILSVPAIVIAIIAGLVG